MLTKRQTQILNFIRRHFYKNLNVPTRREICEKFGFNSPNTVTGHLKALSKKGAIEISDVTSARNYRLSSLACPHCGKELA